jgi:hypothetical protein
MLRPIVEGEAVGDRRREHVWDAASPEVGLPIFSRWDCARDIARVVARPQASSMETRKSLQTQEMPKFC